MSWPDDGSPRFYVQTVTGYRVDPSASGTRGSRVPVSSAVLDRAYAHRIVREFVPSGAIKGSKSFTSITCRHCADQLCAELNAAEIMDDAA